MNILSVISLSTILILCKNNIYSQSTKLNIPAKFINNNKIDKDIQFYNIEGDSIYHLNYDKINTTLIFESDDKFGILNILMVSRTGNVRMDSIRIGELRYLDVYYDSRILFNRVNRKFGGYSGVKNIFSRCYLYDNSSGYVSVVRKSKRVYFKSTVNF